MGWFGLFDLLRFRPGAGPHEGRVLPNSFLRLANAHLAAFYDQAASDLGHGFQPDLYDLASHHLARSAPPEPSSFHLDLRLTGRPASLLFGSDSSHAILAWHAPSAAAQVRLGGASASVAMSQISLETLLTQTLPIEQIATLSAWVADAAALERLMRGLDAFLSHRTRAVIRLPAAALPATLARLAAWPVRCAAILPCPGAGEAPREEQPPADVLLCFDSVSDLPPDAAISRARSAPRVLRRPVWNDCDRLTRSSPQGGITTIRPAGGPGPGLSLALLGDAPATTTGSAVAALRASPYRATEGFDYLLDITLASVITVQGTAVVVPETGPVVIDPALCRDADAAAVPGLRAAESARLLLPPGMLDEGMFSMTRAGPIRRIADRTAFLLGSCATAGRYVTEIWPTLEALFQLCERERIALSDVDILVPGDRHAFIGPTLALLGIAPAQIRSDPEGTLYRRLLVASPTSHAARPQRSRSYDTFWQRLAAMQRNAGFVSFSQSQPSGRVMLADPDTVPLVNGAELAAIARDRGYVVADPAAMPIASLHRLMQTARVIVGPAALMGWSCLAAECSLGLVMADNAPTPPHAALHAAAARGHVVTVTFGAAIGSGAQAGFVVAPERFAALLERIEAQARAAAEQAR